jgi:hypothetical protein
MDTFDIFSRSTNAGALPDQTLDLMDSVVDSELAWRESVAAVGSAYRTWCAAPDHDRGLSFSCYVAALDQEEAAAAAFAASSLQLELAVGCI